MHVYVYIFCVHHLIGPPTFRRREQQWNRPFTRPIFPVWRKMVWERDYNQSTQIGNPTLWEIDTGLQVSDMGEATSESVFSVGIWLKAFFNSLTVFQNCLHPCHDTFLKCSLFDIDCLRMFTTWFLSEVYLFHKGGHPVFLALLYTLFLFLIFVWWYCSSRGGCV